VLKRKVDKGVILAAGDGERLGSLTLTFPKVLLPTLAKTLGWAPMSYIELFAT